MIHIRDEHSDALLSHNAMMQTDLKRDIITIMCYNGVPDGPLDSAIYSKTCLIIIIIIEL